MRMRRQRNNRRMEEERVAVASDQTSFRVANVRPVLTRMKHCRIILFHNVASAAVVRTRRTSVGCVARSIRMLCLFRHISLNIRLKVCPRTRASCVSRSSPA
uniref:Uncharacterized protein n=1 Tax=Cacopsylla melanoneura TaxID=428564 RepID=A0A8D8SMF2_9HEMI